MISPGDLVNCDATLKELACVRNVAAEFERAVDELTAAVESHGERRTIALIMSVRGSSVLVCVVSSSGCCSAVTLPRRRLIVLKGGGMSTRERDLRSAFSERVL